MERNHSSHILQGRVFASNLTKKNNDTKTTGEHRINDTNTTFSKVGPQEYYYLRKKRDAPSVAHVKFGYSRFVNMTDD